MERKSVKICDLEIRERYNLSEGCELSHSFIVEKINEDGVWVNLFGGVEGLFHITDNYPVFHFPLSPLEKELL